MRSVVRSRTTARAGRATNQLDSATSWVVSDFVDVVVHLFEPSQRMYYDIEALWRNGARVEWRRPEDVEADDVGHEQGL